jgi:hypothetical protein
MIKQFSILTSNGQKRTKYEKLLRCSREIYMCWCWPKLALPLNYVVTTKKDEEATSSSSI